MAEYETTYRLVPPACKCGSADLEQTRGERIEQTSIRRMRCRSCGRAWTRFVEPTTVEDLIQKLAADGSLARMIGHGAKRVDPS